MRFWDFESIEKLGTVKDANAALFDKISGHFYDMDIVQNTKVDLDAGDVNTAWLRLKEAARTAADAAGLSCSAPPQVKFDSVEREVISGAGDLASEAHCTCPQAFPYILLHILVSPSV